MNMLFIKIDLDIFQTSRTPRHVYLLGLCDRDGGAGPDDGADHGGGP